MRSIRESATLAASIFGTGGNDTLRARDEGDRVFGLGGNDILTSQFNRTQLFGGLGHDRVTTNFSLTSTSDEPMDVFTTQDGGAGDDRLSAVTTRSDFGGPTVRNTLRGGLGRDTISAEATSVFDSEASNFLFGGAGADTIGAVAQATQRGSGFNSIRGGSGNDSITAEATGRYLGSESRGTNEIWGDAGDDTIEATARASDVDTATAINMLEGGVGHDTLHGVARMGTNHGRGTGTNQFSGGGGNDSLTAEVLSLGNAVGAMRNSLYGGDGNDVLTARLDEIDDHMSIFTSRNVLDGGAGSDTLTATVAIVTTQRGEASNELRGGGGNDVLTAVASAQVAAGGAPNSAVARNALRGGDGDDVLIAEIVEDVGASRLHGGAGDDRLTAIGGRGNILYGGLGEDVLRGGAAMDTFVFDVADLAANRDVDTINGFNRSVDRLAFFGVTDAGASGLADDLDAMSFINDAGPGGDVTVWFGPESNEHPSIVLRGRGTGNIDSFADLVANPATQLVVATPDMLA